jgi:hypothetical protein
VTEIDDLFAHEPLPSRTRSVLDSYAREAFEAGRYDFHMGRKLRGHLERAGFTVSSERALEDQELSFAGPASPEVAEAWRARFDRLKLLRDLCGESFDGVRQDFLDCLAGAGHRSVAKVCCCIATK